jgi:hypothetical protein
MHFELFVESAFGSHKGLISIELTSVPLNEKLDVGCLQFVLPQLRILGIFGVGGVLVVEHLFNEVFESVLAKFDS